MRRGTLASFSFIALTIFDSSIDFIARLPAAHFQFCGADDDDGDDDAMRCDDDGVSFGVEADVART